MSVRKRRSDPAPGSAWVVATAAPEEVDPPPALAPGGEPLDTYDLALLTGGPELAITVALVALEGRGVIRCGQDVSYRLMDLGPPSSSTDPPTTPVRHVVPGVVARTGRPLPVDVHPIEQAVYDAVPATSDGLFSIRSAVVVAPAMAAARSRLVQLGFHRSEPNVTALARRVRWVRAGLVAVTISGILTLFTGDLNPELASPFVMAMLYAFCLQGEMAGLTMRRSPTHRILRAARGEHRLPHGASVQAPAGRVPGLCLLVAVHGAPVLWVCDPALARALCIPHPPAHGPGALDLNVDLGDDGDD